MARTRCTDRWRLLVCLLLSLQAGSAAASLCALPGAPGLALLSGQINHYWQPRDGIHLTPGSTAIPLAPGQSPVALSRGDVLLVLQMQGADIHSRNDAGYGDGTGAGLTQLQAGHFEWVRVEQVSAQQVVIRGGGPGAGLLHGYAQQAPTLTRGSERFQLVRVPQYEQARLTGRLTAAPWNGYTGGVLALEVRGLLDLNGQTLDVAELGFRGGAALGVQGGVGDQRDFAFRAPSQRELAAGYGLHASKGEGLAGTPRYVLHLDQRLDSWPAADSQRVSDGYPGGSFARGAPANAGGGAASARVDNRLPAGGGGGGGGEPGRTGVDPGGRNAGGRGAAGVSSQWPWLVLGGGGGAGTRAEGQGLAGSGGSGGGILVVRAGEMTGQGTFNLRGQPGWDGGDQGGSGGGGGGGSLWLEVPLAPSVSPEIRLEGGAGGRGRAAGGRGGQGRVLVGGTLMLDPALVVGGADSRTLGVLPAYHCRPLGMLISGEIYIDNGGAEGALAAHDGRRQPSEEGVPQVPVWLENTEGERLHSTRTTARGLFAFSLDRTLAGEILWLRSELPSDLQVMTVTGPDLPGQPFQWQPEKTGWRFVVQAEQHQDQLRLGVIRQPQLQLPAHRTVAPGSTQLFLMQYHPHTHGEVRFALDTDSPSRGDWKHTFFIDPECREESRFMDQGHTSRWFTVTPDTPLCVRLRVDVPSQTDSRRLTVTLGAESRWQGRAAQQLQHRAVGSVVLELDTP